MRGNTPYTASMPITEAASVPPAIWNTVRFGSGDDDASAHTAAALSVSVEPLGHAVAIQKAPSAHHHERRAQAGDARRDCVRLWLVALDPALARVGVDGQRRVSGRVRMQVVDEAVQQFGARVEVEQRRVGMRFERGARRAQRGAAARPCTLRVARRRARRRRRFAPARRTSRARARSP